ncbi:MAG: DUF1365 domain-containing protein [Neomegalonema sp.]|nr:DUF1365 domain-containing protein [Neomegalonema sp.]
MAFEALPSSPAAPSGALDAFTPRLFVGHVMHLRMRPTRHQFRYGMAALWLDADAPEQAAAGLKCFSVDRFGLFSFYRRDHGWRDGSALRPFVEEALHKAGAPSPARLMLLSFPRVLGYVFNPLSVYYGYDRDGRLESMVYEVKNTDGGQHAYAVRLDPGASAHRHSADKCFYVSPFIEMEKRYNFTVSPPAERLALLIKQTDDAGLFLSASWNGRAEPLTDGRLLRRFFSHPLHPQRVMARIYWEAIRLRIKGVRSV